jgi:hypothetical protein
MNSTANKVVDRAFNAAAEPYNPAANIPVPMQSFVDEEMNKLKNIARNFLPRHFEFRTNGRERKLHVVQLMSEYQGNFSTPVCYL